MLKGRKNGMNKKTEQKRLMTKHVKNKDVTAKERKGWKSEKGGGGKLR